MGLAVPTIGVEAGPNWATDLNASLSTIDQHNHSSGQGVPINPSGININSDLLMNINNLTLAKSVRFSPLTVALSSASDIGCLYEVNADLYYNDGSGNQIRITQGGAVTGASGTITGLPSGTASASYSGGTFTFQAATSTAANLDGASLVLRNSSASSNGLTLSPPNAMGSNYSLTLPSLPGSTLFVTLDTSGNLGTATSIQPTQIAAASIQSAQLAAGVATPPGAVIMYGGASAPTGWLLCDGASLSTTTFAALFAAVGYTYGGSGSSFNAPDARGIFVRGAGTSGTLVNGNSAAYSGTLGAAVKDQMQGHVHNIGIGTTGALATAFSTANTIGSFPSSQATADGANGTVTTGSETAPANISLTYIIKT